MVFAWCSVCDSFVSEFGYLVLFSVLFCCAVGLCDVLWMFLIQGWFSYILYIVSGNIELTFFVSMFRWSAVGLCGLGVCGLGKVCGTSDWVKH